jgi:hypothetical protein
MTYINAGGLSVRSVRLAEARLSITRTRRTGLVRFFSATIAPLPNEARVHILGKGGVLIKQIPVAFNKAVWDGTDHQGRRVPAGIYHALLETGAEKRFIKIIARP